MDLTKLTISQAAKLLKEKKISSLELTKSVLERIKKLNKKLNAYITVCVEESLKQARESDKRLAKSKRLSEIDGIPLAIKDNICLSNIPTTCGSKMLDDFIPPYDATVIGKLRAAGAIFLGKTNMDEFAMGSSTETSYFGPTKNPWDLERVPGGSSGGSAAAVAADLCLGALGSDTGGSIRQPASFCGVVGLKPTYGRVSRYGLIAYGSSLDQIGPITKTVEDAKILYNIISGYDPLDSTSVDKNPKSEILNPKQIQNSKFQNLKIGIPREFFADGLDKAVEIIVKKAIKKLEELGAKVSEVSLPYIKYALPSYYIIALAEASSNLARFDGIKYGFSVEAQSSQPKAGPPLAEKLKVQSLLDVYLKSRAEGFGAEVKRRIMLGTYCLSAGYYEAYYLKAQKVRALVKKDFEKAFEKFDLLATPVSPTVAFKIGEKIEDPLTMYLSDVCTVPINPAGLPAISLPCGLVNNLPVGLQIIGRQFDEETILNVAKIYEENTPWHKQKSKL